MNNAHGANRTIHPNKMKKQTTSPAIFSFSMCITIEPEHDVRAQVLSVIGYEMLNLCEQKFVIHLQVKGNAGTSDGGRCPVLALLEPRMSEIAERRRTRDRA